MKLSYRVTLADYRASLCLRRKLRLSLRLSYLFWYFVIPGLTLAVVLLTFPFTTEARTKELGTFLQVDLWLLIFAAIVPVSSQLKILNRYKKLTRRGNNERTFEVEINDEYFLDITPGEEEAKILWGAVERFAQNEIITMLLLSGARFHYFPTRALSTQQRVELDDLITRQQIRK